MQHIHSRIVCSPHRTGRATQPLFLATVLPIHMPGDVVIIITRIKRMGSGRERKGGKRRIGTKVEQIAAVKSDDTAPPVIPNSKWLAANATMVVTNCEYSAQFAASFSACILLEGTSYCVSCPCKLLYCTTDYGRPSSSSFLPCYSFLSPSLLGWRHSAAADPSLLNRLHCCHLQLLRNGRRRALKKKTLHQCLQTLVRFFLPATRARRSLFATCQ